MKKGEIVSEKQKEKCRKTWEEKIRNGYVSLNKGRSNQKISELLKGKSNPKISKILKGRISPFRGDAGSIRSKKISTSLLGHVVSKETINKIAAKVYLKRKGKTFEEIYGVEKAKELRIKHSFSMKGRPSPFKGLTKDVDERARKISFKLKGKHLKSEHLQKILQTICKTPNSYESRIIHLIEQYDLPFKYIGDGKEIIGYVNPDFRDTLGLNPPCVIETFTRWCHRKNYEETRHKELCIPKENVLFLSDEDLNRKDWEKYCLIQIKRFCKEFILKFVNFNQIDVR